MSLHSVLHSSFLPYKAQIQHKLCQAVSDVRGKFVDISIMYPGSTCDMLSFEGRNVYQKLKEGVLAEGLCVIGDNECIKTKYMLMPFYGKMMNYMIASS